MDNALRNLPKQNAPEVLVGFENSDDAGVFLIAPGLALVQTVDFFSPIVDDPYTYGAIAATNALSDVYAMGGIPRTALSIVGFPSKEIDPEILGEIMRGGLSKLNEAGVALLGGHSVRDDEVKFGYAITGTVAIQNIKQNKNAVPGDQVVLTKALGTGLITTALKRGNAEPQHVTQALAVMSQLNRVASEVALQHKVHAMTDVTGFGLIGHAWEVAKASNVAIRILPSTLPVLPGALEYSRAGFRAGGLNNNQAYYSQHVRLGASVPADLQDVMYDPQTSGGLLMFVDPGDTAALIEALHQAGLTACLIGQVMDPGEPQIQLG